MREGGEVAHTSPICYVFDHANCFVCVCCFCSSLNDTFKVSFDEGTQVCVVNLVLICIHVHINKLKAGVYTLTRTLSHTEAQIVYVSHSYFMYDCCRVYVYIYINQLKTGLHTHTHILTHVRLLSSVCVCLCALIASITLCGMHSLSPSLSASLSLYICVCGCVYMFMCVCVCVCV